MNHRLPIIALVLSSIFWGIAIPFFKLAIHVPPFSYGVIRFGLAALILGTYYVLSRQFQPIAFSHMGKIIWIALLGVSINISLLFIGLRLTQASQAAVITNLTPLLLVFAAAMFLKEPLTKKHVIGAVIALVGTLFIIGSPLSDAANPPSVILGDILIIISTIAWVGFTIVSKELFRLYSPLTLTVWIFILGFVSFIPFAIYELISQPTWPAAMTSLDIISLCYYTIFGTILAYLFYQYGLSKVSADITAFTQYITPVVTIIFAILFLGERLSIPFAIGAALTFAGILYATTKSRAIRQPQELPK